MPTDHNPTADFLPPGDNPAGSHSQTLTQSGALGPVTGSHPDSGTADPHGPSTASEFAVHSGGVTGADPTADDPDPAGSVPAAAPLPDIPGYLVEAEIARGGMGVVYRVRDTTLSRNVAVKVLQDRYSVTSLAARRFVDEAKITGQLQHPGIPPVHEFGALPNGRPFLVMKLIKGRTLAAMIADGQRNRGSLVAVFEQVCQAVAYAHNHGVVHRDLKPQNVMVGAFGEVQVMDWGLAKLRAAARAEWAEATTATTFHDPRTQADSDLQTRAGSFLGTPAYMSPEQAIGAVDQVDERSDVFGLGAVLCAILTGEPPFVAATSESTRQLAARKQVEPAFARLDASEAEPALVALCKRCLAGEREERFRNAGEVAEGVHTIRAEVEERARRAELDRVKAEGERATAEARAGAERDKAEEQQKRRRVQLVLVGVVAAVLAGAGVATALVIEQRALDKLAAEQKQSEVRFDAEQKRKADLQAADEKARAEQLAAERRTRTEGLVQALGTAETAGVPRIVFDLADLRDLARPKLIELVATEPVTNKPGLHARLALADDPQRAAELAAYLPTCKAEELLTIRDALKPHAKDVSVGLWGTLTDAKADSGKRVRAACALAGFSATDERWAEVVAAVTDAVVTANPSEFVVWSVALEPVRGFLVPRLLGRYLSAQTDIRGGKLDESALAAAVGGYNLTADLLRRYTWDSGADLGTGTE